MNTDHPAPHGDAHVLSYMGLRKTVGVIAIALPLVLVFGRWGLAGVGMESSISAYYYTGMRDVLVGSLCAIAMFLLSYKGYERQDDIAGDMACAFALGIALFPTVPAGDPTPAQIVLGRLHAFCAGAFFLTLAYFSLVLFRKGVRHPTPRKVLRNRVYTVCGWTIVGCVLGLGIVHLLPREAAAHQLNPIFWLEAVGIWAFGWSWFTKGEGILSDQEL